MQACRRGIRSQHVPQAGSQRLLSVVAWGRNAEGQCGVDHGPLVTEPAQLDALASEDVDSVAAGSLHSAAVLRDGTVLTWGSGKAGKLGHGVGDNMAQPTRVESLWGRSAISQAALGASHSLFLDKGGGVWACGENKEGQCGLGTPLEVLAKQRRQEWALGANMATFAQAFREVAQEHSATPDAQAGLDGGSGLGGGGGGVPASWHQHSSSSAAYSPTNQHLKPFIEHREREEELERARQMFAGAASMRAVESDSVFGTFQGNSPIGNRRSGGSSSDSASLAGMFGRMGGLMPGQHHTPIRIGRDLHPLLSLGAEPGSASGNLSDTEAAAAQQQQQQEQRGIGGQQVAGVAAAKYFSVLRTVGGEVWTCGGGFNGELGQQSSWVTSASQVSGHVREALAENGGAVAVECGATFCVALTASGRVVVWGSPPGSPAAAKGRRSGWVMAVEVMGLPPITSVAAGLSHCLMTDGQRVWAMGSWLLANGTRGGTEWGVPQHVAGLPDGAGIALIAAGARASAAVTADGQLWMWGRLMAEDNARALVQQTTGYAPTERQAKKWMWEGMGTDGPPVLVPGLGRVAGVQLGSAHALSLVHDD